MTEQISKQCVLNIKKEIFNTLIERLKISLNNETLWFGVIEEVDPLNYNSTEFIFPPQIQTLFHCETDDDKWPQFAYEHIVKPRKNIRLEAHTHPTFLPFPSDGDCISLQKRIKSMGLEIDEYIFEWILSYNNTYYCKKHTIIDDKYTTKSELVTINIIE